MDRGAWWATVHGSQRVERDWATDFFLQKFKLCLYSWNIKNGSEESTSERLLDSKPKSLVLYLSSAQPNPSRFSEDFAFIMVTAVRDRNKHGKFREEFVSWETMAGFLKCPHDCIQSFVTMCAFLGRDL